MMRKQSILSEAREIRLATELVGLGARLQLLEAETNLSRERLVRLYKEIRGVSPPKGMLPYSTDWFISWKPNIHGSLFMAIHRYLLAYTDVQGVDALIRSYRLYLEHIQTNHLERVLSLTRAWILLRFVDGHLLHTVPCTRCGGSFLAHTLDLCSDYVCGLCKIPSRAGMSRKPCTPARSDELLLSAA